MLPSFLITFREVIEATLIVATILGILVKLNRTKSIKTFWFATISAIMVSIGLLGVGSLVGVKVQELYTGRAEEIIEGILMVVSAGFITWAVFFLHNYFAQYKTHLLTKIKSTVEQKKGSQRALFALVFTAVFREGFEIVLFLSTIYFASNPAQIFSGFAGGIIAGLVVSYLFFTTTLKLPVYYAFRTTSVLLILFAAGLLAHGVHEFHEAGFYPEIWEMTHPLLPEKSTIMGGIIQSMFGVTKQMDTLQLIAYTGYIFIMNNIVFGKKSLQTSSIQ
ncbi:MAG: FTR1 family protein [Candidatus Roizmanbacteria bacterium]|nr:FTR1 family protein [Candidatus Roizmanbacteria bacterium]